MANRGCLLEINYYTAMTILDTSFMAFLHECGLPEEKIHRAFQLAFNSDYDERRTQTMYDRAKALNLIQEKL